MKYFGKAAAVVSAVMLLGGCEFPPKETPQKIYDQNGEPLGLIRKASASSSSENWGFVGVIGDNPPYSSSEESTSVPVFTDDYIPHVPTYHKRTVDEDEYERDYEDYITEPAAPIIYHGTSEAEFHGDDNNGKLPKDKS